jgi:sRNA-binding protein
MANRKAKIAQTIAELQAAFPLAFFVQADRIKPLGIGIKQQIYGRCTLSHREVGAALRGYTGRVAYLLKIIEGAVRFDLDGAASGNVTAKEATHAAEQIKKILAKAAGEPKSKIEPITPAKDTPARADITKSPAMSGVSKPESSPGKYCAGAAFRSGGLGVVTGGLAASGRRQPNCKIVREAAASGNTKWLRSLAFASRDQGNSG